MAKTNEKKSAKLKQMEETFGESTRRFSPFKVLGIPSLKESQVSNDPDPTSPSESEPVIELPKADPPQSNAQKSADQEYLAELPIHAIQPNPFQPRLFESLDADKQLRQSIETSGLLQPILVRPTESGQYELIAGERRWRACKGLQKTTIQAIVRVRKDVDMAVEAIVENIIREELTPLEEAKAYESLVTRHHHTQAQVAELVGVTPGRVSQLMKLLTLPEDVQQTLFHSETPMSSGVGETLAGLNGNPTLQRELARQAIKDRWTRDQLLAQINRAPRTNRGFNPVQFSKRGNKGFYLTVRFHSNRSQDIPEIREALQEALDLLKPQEP